MRYKGRNKKRGEKQKEMEGGEGKDGRLCSTKRRKWAHARAMVCRKKKEQKESKKKQCQNLS